MFTFKQAAVVVALALTGPALAQAPAPPPARAQGKPALTAEQQAALGAVWVGNQVLIPLGGLAAARGASDEVKKYAKAISDAQGQLATQLKARMQERGLDPANLPPAAARAQLAEDAKQLQTRSGQDFDGAFVTFMKQHGEQLVDDLKRARDGTPGEDPELKKLLDQAEDAQEGYLTQARQLDQKRVQARRPQ